MPRIERVLSITLAKPYRTKDLRNEDEDATPCTNEQGHLAFAPHDIENPKNWSTTRRWFITFSGILTVLNATFASSSVSGCLPSISSSLHVSTEAAGLTITVFLLANSFGPLFWAPLSEFYGRRWIFYGTFLGYLAFNLLCAWAPNFGALLVGRFLTRLFSSSTQANVPGLLADIWEPNQRSVALMFFAVSVLVGPALGPVVAGFLELKKDWRWTMYVLLWAAAGTLPFLFTIPETLPDQILFRGLQAPAEASNRSLRHIFKVTLTRPWKIFFDPIASVCCVYQALVYALLYMLFSIYPIVFHDMRGWNVGVSELPLLGTMIGAFVGGAINYYFIRRDRERRASGADIRPEDRLTVAKIGGIMFPVSMFWFSWTANYNSIHWIVPTLAGVFLSASFLLIFVGYLNYLVDNYLSYAASALAANTVLRTFCGAAAPLFTTYMFRSLTVAGGGSLIAGLACLLAVIPFVFSKYGEQIRKRSKYIETDQQRAPDGKDSTVENDPSSKAQNHV
ncbi:Major facilitator superfamily multidrug transporter mdrA, partial [Pseudocercospora fuligena]